MECHKRDGLSTSFILITMHKSSPKRVPSFPTRSLPPSLPFQELVSQLEAQLSLLRERLSGSEAECSKLRVEVERAGRRMDERESSSQQQQQQLTAIFDSLRADSEKVYTAAGVNFEFSSTRLLQSVLFCLKAARY